MNITMNIIYLDSYTSTPKNVTKLELRHRIIYNKSNHLMQHCFKERKYDVIRHAAIQGTIRLRNNIKKENELALAQVTAMSRVISPRRARYTLHHYLRASCM